MASSEFRQVLTDSPSLSTSQPRRKRQNSHEFCNIPIAIGVGRLVPVGPRLDVSIAERSTTLIYRLYQAISRSMSPNRASVRTRERKLYSPHNGEYP